MRHRGHSTCSFQLSTLALYLTTGGAKEMGRETSELVNKVTTLHVLH